MRTRWLVRVPELPATELMLIRDGAFAMLVDNGSRPQSEEWKGNSFVLR